MGGPMAAEWLAVAKGVTTLGEKIFGGLNKYQKLKAADREKVADLLDMIAKDVLQIAKQMNKKDIPETPCARILTYSVQLPPLLERVYDKEIADQLRLELAEVYDSRRLARAILSSDRRGLDTKEQLDALTSTIEAAAGTIAATANCLRAI
jgi:hypothetical protein